MKIIFFTKDRPMQYRAFLESFLYNAKDIKQSNIVTIISNTNGYEDILEEFKNIKFINDEGKFFNDILRNEINNTFSDYILFGCDDEIVIRSINLQNAKNHLDSNPDCIGYSLRLGNNIEYSRVALNIRDSKNQTLKWNWRHSSSHWGYPWELMATIYPTWICQEIINSQKDNIKTPNFYESFGVNFCSNNPNMPSFMMCDDSTGAFIAADVNRIQLEFENKVQNFSGRDLSAANLLKMYKEGYRLNWINYQNKIYNDIFIGDKDLEFIQNSQSLFRA